MRDVSGLSVVFVVRVKNLTAEAQNNVPKCSDCDLI